MKSYFTKNMSDTTLLNDQFELVRTASCHLYNLTLSREIFLCQRISQKCSALCSSPTCIINLHDIYGAKALRNDDTSDTAAYFQIFACPSKKKRRKVFRICFRVAVFNDVILNLDLARLWVRAFSWLLREPAVDFTKIRGGPLPAARKLLVLINPSSGQGKSLQIFREKVEPMLVDADINYKAIVTDYANHGKEIAHQLDVTEWDGIVICSGDGLVHEVINGLLERTDWEKAIRMPVGVIPTGSGNALCFGALHSVGEYPRDLTSAIFAVIRGHTQPLDICSVETPNRKIYSFLSVAWGIISDVDIESEKYRYMGNTRFLVGAVVRIVGLRVYRGKLSYLPVDNGDEQNYSSATIANELTTPHRSSDANGVTENISNGFRQFEEKVMQLKKNKVQTKEFCEPKELASPILSSVNARVVDCDFKNDDRSNGPQTDKLAPLHCPVPSNWKSLEGEFVFICPVYISHLNPDTNIAPKSKFGDGIIFISYVRSGVSRASLVNMLLKMESGDHVSCSDFGIVRALAFRLEPDLGQSGIIAVDGEMIPYSSVQAQIHKGLARVMCWKTPCGN